MALARSPCRGFSALSVLFGLALGGAATGVACSSGNSVPALGGNGLPPGTSDDGGPDATQPQADSGGQEAGRGDGGAPMDAAREGNAAGDAGEAGPGGDGGCGNPTRTLWSGAAGDLVVGNGRVYFVGGGSLSATSIDGDGGAPQVLSAGTHPLRLALDATNAYFTSGGAVMSVPADGSAAATLIAQGAGAAGAIAVDATNVYWIAGGTPPQLLSAPKAGGAPTVLVGDAGAGAASPNGGNLFAVATGTGTNLVWLDAEAGPNGQVLMLPRASAGSPIVLFGGGNGGLDLQVVGSNVFWTDADGGYVGPTLLGLGDAGGAARSSVPGLVNQFYLDAQNVYVLTPTAQVLRAPRNVWAYQEISCGTGVPGHITADPEFVYFTTDQGVFRTSM